MTSGSLNTTGSLGVILPGWTKLFSGKIRDIYRPTSASPHAGSDVYLIVASDRIAAFDKVIPTKIPGKGKILTQLSLWWFDRTKEIISNHVIAADNSAGIEGRGMLVRGLQMAPYEIKVHGYLTDRVLREYIDHGTVGRSPAPMGKYPGDAFDTPILSASFKGPLGQKDTAITWPELRERVGARRANKIEDVAIRLYERGREISAQHGLILADAKFEFGSDADAASSRLIFADEAFTPDSAHYWVKEEFERTRERGEIPRSYDKEIIGKWLAGPKSGWNPASGTQPPPIPQDVVDETLGRYVRVYEMLTGYYFLRPA